jgi:oligopeptide/dipeptide ABC transporter ATP-binding protein
MDDLRNRTGTAIILITHDLGVIAQSCDRVLVMYAGQVVETGSVYDIFHKPQHPYTHALLESIPKTGPKQHGQRLPTIEGIVPGLMNLPPGCRFHDRCKFCEERCIIEAPQLTICDDVRSVRCHFPLNQES